MFGQKAAIKKADAYVRNNEFIKAIPLYKRASSKNDDALQKLADCYRIIKNYDQAEEYYKKYLEKKPSEPMAHYYLGAILLINNKYEEAKKQFSIYSVLNPDDNKGEIYAKVCDKAKDMAEKPSVYKIYNLGNINSEVSDFCPAFYKDGIVFSSERVMDLINFSESGSSGRSYSSLVYSPGQKNGDTVAYSDAELFSEKFTLNGAYGPACFNADFSEMYFMKVSKRLEKKNGINQPKIYCSKYKNGWGAPELLPFNSDDFATGHPSLSIDGQYLYFTSNRPGGFGGSDIWVSKRESSSWGAPQNLGDDVNTSEAEAYPYITADNILYFSSKGHGSFGGLDIFSSEQRSAPDGKSGGKWAAANNLMLPVNSTADDFGIIFKTRNSGYFTSNRPGGKGSDDLYGFQPSGMFTTVEGKILLSTNTADITQNLRLLLVSNKGEIVGTAITDTAGAFKFENLPTNQRYTVRADERNQILADRKKLYMAGKKDRIVRIARKSKEGLFIFKDLPVDLNQMIDLSEEGFSIAGNLYSGDERTPVQNTRVNLVNDKGEILQSAATNIYGSFVFMDLPPDQNFMIMLDAEDPKIINKKIYFTNKNGREIAMTPGPRYRFRILASDKNTLSLLKVEDSQLLVDLEGALFENKNGKPALEKTTVYLVDEKENIVGTYETDASGKFKFVNLPADKNFMIRLKEDDPSLFSKDVFMADAKGKIVAVLKHGKKYFRYTVLAAEEQYLANIYYNDPWLVAGSPNELKGGQLTIIENIYFDYQKWELGPQAIVTLNKVAGIMQKTPDISILLIAHTDSRGTGEFNMELSQKRAQAAVDYIVAKGISKSRLTAKGMGESQLANKCKDGIECSEEEHAQNRRTEFKVMRGGK